MFDDDFVKRAAVAEPDWRGRKREATRLARKARRARRRQQVVGGARRAGGYLVVAALVVVLLGVAGFGPLGSLKRDSSKPSATARPIVRKRATKKSNSSGSTTTTVYHLLRRSYDRGDCVFFDESPGTGTRDTQVVDCSRPHVIEMTTSIDVGGRFDHFPTNVEWRAVYNRDCAPSIRALLGAPIDPVGRFYPTGVQPSQESWAENDRTVWCGVGALSLTRPAHPFQDVPFTGNAEGTSQARIFPVGSCASTDTAFVVPCAQKRTSGRSRGTST
ncbi:MAG TPA: septum formation family protein [Acidimicrobiia bacterium]|nr:septum formation family protein [Acidimicrobiia bacterium]